MVLRGAGSWRAKEGESWGSGRSGEVSKVVKVHLEGLRGSWEVLGSYGRSGEVLEGLG